MSQLGDKVCPNHPNTIALSRCETCFKPLCSECAISKEDKDFCSKTCETNYFTTNKSIEDFRKQESRQKFVRIIKKFTLLAILIFAGFLLFWFWANNKEKVESTTDQLKDKAKGLKQSLDKKLKK